MSMIWYVNGQLMPSPTTYKIKFTDLDNDSYRSVTNGNLIRNVIRRRWAKISVSWSCIDAKTVNKIAVAVNQENTTFRCLSPAFASGYIVFDGYTSEIETELLEGMVGYSMNFNIIQSKEAPFQGG